MHWASGDEKIIIKSLHVPHNICNICNKGEMCAVYKQKSVQNMWSRIRLTFITSLESETTWGSFSQDTWAGLPVHDSTCTTGYCLALTNAGQDLPRKGID